MMMGHDDFAVEPVKGLPEPLPKDEHILWQGTPRWKTMARTVYHADIVAYYFAALMTARGAIAYSQTGNIGDTISASLSLAPLAFLAVGLLMLLAWATSRAAVYTITDKRVVMRVGVALTKAINLPYTALVSADAKMHRDGTGDIAVSLQEGSTIGYAHLWPHVRPWHLRKPQPMMRTISEGRTVASLLATAMQKAAIARGVRVAALTPETPAGNSVEPAFGAATNAMS